MAKVIICQFYFPLFLQYEHLIGSESALDAARVMETNKSFGMVSSESKKDKRSVEVIQAEIRAKKKMKLAQEEEADEVIMPH